MQDMLTDFIITDDAGRAPKLEVRRRGTVIEHLVGAREILQYIKNSWYLNYRVVYRGNRHDALERALVPMTTADCHAVRAYGVDGAGE